MSSSLFSTIAPGLAWLVALLMMVVLGLILDLRPPLAEGQSPDTGDLGPPATRAVAAALAAMAGLVAGRLTDALPAWLHLGGAVALTLIGLAIAIAALWRAGRAEVSQSTRVDIGGARVIVEIDASGRFRIRRQDGRPLRPDEVCVMTLRTDGLGQKFNFVAQAGFLEATSPAPARHPFSARLSLGQDGVGREFDLVFLEGAAPMIDVGASWPTLLVIAALLGLQFCTLSWGEVLVAGLAAGLGLGVLLPERGTSSSVAGALADRLTRYAAFARGAALAGLGAGTIFKMAAIAWSLSG